MRPIILVIDDEESIRFTFKTFLSWEGYDVLTSRDYGSAIDRISREDIDLIFADIVLGDFTGVDILSAVKERGLWCPVIMITGKPSVDTAADSLRLGAFDYLPKPINKELLLRVTRLALEHKAIVDEKKVVEAEKERYRNNLEAIFRSVNDGIITVDKGMHVIEANDAIESICGVAPADVIGKLHHHLSNRCHNLCHEVLKKTLVKEVKIKKSRIECRHKDRPLQVATVTSSPLMDNNSQSIGAVLVIRDVTRLNDLERELKERHRFHNVVGRSRKMQEIYVLLEDLARTDTTVLITGESGTGKELIAKALHYSGPRASKPLIAVNCSALTENLLESELFGHVKGAFTGALKDKVGRFQAADRGTIFLDEIGDISRVIQLKLLRVLQEKEFERVGDSSSIKVDTRIIASTNQQLKDKVKLGEFREDLYYRLKVVEIHLPPLRDRLEDIHLLVDRFCNYFNKRFNKKIEGITDGVLDTFMHYPWPGNIRELEHSIEHAFVLCHAKSITIDHIPSEIKEFSDAGPIGKGRSTQGSGVKILRALEKAAWNKAKAARLLGISRQTLYRKIKKFNIVKPIE